MNEIFFPWCAGVCGNKSYLRCSSNTETFRFSFLLLRHGPPSDCFNSTYIFTKYFVWRTAVITHSLKDFLKWKKHSLKSAFSHSNNRSVNKTSSVDRQKMMLYYKNISLSPTRWHILWTKTKWKSLREVSLCHWKGKQMDSHVSDLTLETRKKIIPKKPPYVWKQSASAFQEIFQLSDLSYSAGIYLLKVNNKNTGTTCEIFSKTTIKTPLTFNK